MKIIIAGAGEVGTHLAKMLSLEHNDITLVDDNEKRLTTASSVSDVVPVLGSLTSFEVLKRSGATKCDLFIAVSPDEQVNIVAATIAKGLGARKTVVRIDEDEYLKPNNKEIFINMGIDYMFYPEKVAAREVITLLGHTSTAEYVDFSGGHLTLVGFTLDPTSSLINKTLLEATKDRNNLQYRTVAISRGDKTIIPRGDEYFKKGDMIYVIANRGSQEEVLRFSGKTDVEVKNVMILGGSHIGRLIAKELQGSMNIKMIDYNAEKAEMLAETLTKTLVIHEDGRKLEVMLEEGINNMDAFIALTGRSETNILAGMLAKKMGVKKVIAEVENLNYIDLAESVGIDTIINKKLITASAMFRFTMNTDVQAIKCLNGCDAEVLEFIVKPDSPATRGMIKHINFHLGAIVGGVVRGDKAFIARGETQLKAYDRVVVFALPNAIAKVGKFFE